MAPNPAKRQKIPTSVGTFTVLPLALPTLPGLPESLSSAKHYLYIQPHNPSQTSSTTSSSLFVANVPIDASEANIRALFAEQLGGARVSHVEFDSAIPAAPEHKRWKGNAPPGAKAGSKRKREDTEVVAEGVVEDAESALPRTWSAEVRASGGSAVVVFVDRKSMVGAWKEVRKVAKEGGCLDWGVGEGVGVDRYKSHFALQYPAPTALHNSATNYLIQFDQVQALRNRLLAASRAVPDEDGFITVTRGGGRTAPAARIEQAELKRDELEERKKKNAIKDDFYRFQNREKRKEKENELRKGFERDRKRVMEMRERRGKPVPER